jgi:hypothetical protein
VGSGLGVRFGFGLVNMIGNSSCVFWVVVTIRVGVKVGFSVRFRFAHTFFSCRALHTTLILTP